MMKHIICLFHSSFSSGCVDNGLQGSQKKKSGENSSEFISVIHGQNDSSLR